jgi:codanin-1
MLNYQFPYVYNILEMTEAENLWQELLNDVGLPQDNNTNQWLTERFASTSAKCTVEEFAVFFFATVKTQTDEFIKSNTSTCNTPRKLTGTVDNLPDSNVKPELIEQKVTVEKPQAFRRNSSRELFGHQDVNFQPIKGQDSPQLISKKSLTPLNSSTPVMTYKRVNLSIDSTPTNTSTPQSARNNTKNSFDQSSNSFRNSSRNSLDFSSRNTSMNKRNTSSPFCLGDFLNTSSTSSSGKGGKKKNASQQSPLDSTPKFSNTDFPSLECEVKKAESKPKKRVVPTTISRKNTPGTTSFISSSFQSENNLLNLSPFETEEIDILSERRMLCDQRNAISKDFSVEKEPQRNLHAIVKESFPVVAQSPSRPRPQFQYDESKVENIEVLTMMANIYSFLLDMNFVPNILTEFSYLFNLLNTEYNPFENLQHQSHTQGKSMIENILKNLQNCVFFSACVLSCQKRNLALLDAMTIRVLIENERVQQIAGELFDHLRFVMHQKSQLDASMAKQMSRTGGNINNVVFFQQETDNRDNFPSDREFGAFKKQRDLFYSILRYWELKHLDPAWDFRKELGMKIRSLVVLMEHPINMAHLARLFTAQLIISCNFDNSANELQMVLPNIDLSKLSKLRQRLVAPSVFSTQYQFAGNQTFFRDFIVCCDQHMIFMEQLKISLVNELLQINDSSMETLCISPVDETLEKSFPEEFVVSAEMMTTMRVLAKFVGFVISRPYSYEGYRNTLVDQQQSQIRNLVS